MHVTAAPTALEAALQQEMGELQADKRKLQSEVADLQSSLAQVLTPPPPPRPPGPAELSGAKLWTCFLPGRHCMAH